MYYGIMDIEDMSMWEHVFETEQEAKTYIEETFDGYSTSSFGIQEAQNTCIVAIDPKYFCRPIAKIMWQEV